MGRRPARAPAQACQAALSVRPTAISSTGMDAAVASGQAAPLSQVVAFIMRHQYTWWLSTPVGWPPIPPPIAGILDEHAERMRHQDALTAANHAAIRAVIDLARAATETRPASTPGKLVGLRPPSTARWPGGHQAGSPGQ